MANEKLRSTGINWIGQLLFLLSILSTFVHAQTRIYVAPAGNDAYAGTLTAPLATIERALEKVRTAPQSEVHILLRKGVYYLPQTVRIDPQRIGTKKLLISAYQGERVELNGGRKLNLRWQKTDGPVWIASVMGEPFEQLFVNGKKQVLARYPNYDSTARVFNGTAADAISNERIRR